MLKQDGVRVDIRSWDGCRVRAVQSSEDQNHNDDHRPCLLVPQYCYYYIVLQLRHTHNPTAVISQDHKATNYYSYCSSCSCYCY